jgi:hypothetical protein
VTLEELQVLLEQLFPLRGARGKADLVPAEPVDDPRWQVHGPLHAGPWSITVALRLSPLDGPTSRLELTVCEPRHLTDPRLPAYVDGWTRGLTTLLHLATYQSANRWAPGYVDVLLPLEVRPVGASAEDYHADFISYPWFGRLLPERPATPPPYVMPPAEIVVRDGQLDVASLGVWIYRQVARSYSDRKWDAALVKALPEPVRVLDGAQMIDAMVGGNGFETFLGQTDSFRVRQCHAALVAVGAPRLAALMAMGIDLARREGCEFAHERATAWLKPFAGLAPAGGWKDIDGHEPDRTYALLKSELEPAMRR